MILRGLSNLKYAYNSTCDTAATGHVPLGNFPIQGFNHFENYYYAVLEEKQGLFCLFVCFKQPEYIS